MENDLYKKNVCRYSGTPLGLPFLELGTMALANSYVKPEDIGKPEFKCPLSLVWNKESGLVQLSHVVPPDLMFSHYLYVSSTTQTFRDHFAAYAASVREKVLGSKSGLAVDIGSNDGLLLSCYMKEGMRAVGVDPAKNLADEANKKGFTTLNRYFDKECVDSIVAEHGKASAVSGNNVFAHIDDIHSVLKNVHDLLDDNGLFVIEFPYLVTMVEQMLFDMIYHEHLSYIAVHPLKYVVERFGFEIFNIDYVSSHGGSLRVFMQKKNGPRAVADSVAQYLDKEKKDGYDRPEIYEDFAKRVLEIRDDFRAMIKREKAAGKRIAGYGAPAKASTLLNFYGLTSSDVDYVVDDNPLKQGYLVPGVGIPIRPSKALDESPVDIIIIFAWNFAREILKKIGHYQTQGVRFVLPLPGPQTALENSQQERRFEISPV